MFTDPKKVSQKDPEELSLIKRPISKTNKASALFNLVEMIVGEKNDFRKLLEILPQEKDGLKNISKISNEIREAYLFKFRGAPLVNLYKKEGYECVERHLIVDKFYSEFIKGFFYAHYTEEYQNSRRESIIVHVYFNRQGKLMYCQVRQGQVLPEVYLEIESDFENKIKNNSLTAAMLLGDLFYLKAQQYREAVSEADDLEKKLVVLLKDFYNKTNRIQYVKISKSFLEKISEINRLNDVERDCRGEVVSEIVEKLQREESRSFEGVPQKIQASPKGGEENSNIEVDSELQVKKQAQAKEKIPKTRLEVDALHSSILALEKELDEILSKKDLSNQPSNMLKGFKIVKELRNQMLELMFLNPLNLKVKEKGENKTIIKRIEGKIKKIPSLVVLLEKCVLKGDVAGFKTLFPEENRSALSCFKILYMVINNKEENNRLLESRIEICDFLFEHSENYRLSVEVLSMFVLRMQGGISVSLFLHACIKDNLSAVSMLIRHGYNLNSLGGKFDQTAISNLKFLMLLNIPKVLELVLDHDIIVNNPNINNQLKTVEVNHPEILKTIFGSVPSAASPFSLSGMEKTSELFRMSSDLFAAWHLEKYELIPSLAERSSLSEVALTFSKILNSKDTSISFVPAANGPGFFCGCNKEERDSIIEKEALEGCQSKSQSVRLFIFNEKEFSEKHKVIKVFCQIFLNKWDESKEQFEKTIADFKQSIEKKKTKIKEERTIEKTKIKGELNDLYNACLLLMVQKEGLSFMDAQEIMQISCYVGRLYCESEKPPERQFALSYFQRVTNIAAFSPFSEKLKKTPIFKYASDNIEAICSYDKKTRPTTIEIKSRPITPAFNKEIVVALAIEDENDRLKVATPKDTKHY